MCRDLRIGDGNDQIEMRWLAIAVEDASVGARQVLCQDFDSKHGSCRQEKSSGNKAFNGFLNFQLQLK